MNLQVAALSFQLFRCHLLAIQVIRQLYIDRKLLVSCSLIIDVLVIGTPGQSLTVL